MIKKRFKQYTILKHKKRIQSFDIAFTKQTGENFFFAPNRVTKTLFKGFPVSLAGCNHYTGFSYDPLAYSFLNYKKVIFPGAWVDTLVKISEKSLPLSSIFPHITLVRVLFVLQARLVTLFHANLL